MSSSPSDWEFPLSNFLFFFLGTVGLQTSRACLDHSQSSFFFNSFFELVPDVMAQIIVFGWIKLHCGLDFTMWCWLWILWWWEGKKLRWQSQPKWTSEVAVCASRFDDFISSWLLGIFFENCLSSSSKLGRTVSLLFLLRNQIEAKGEV